jgi:hypothetical protein
MRWAGHVARMGEKMNVYMLLVGKPTLEYHIRKVQENQAELKLNETHQLLAYAER